MNALSPSTHAVSPIALLGKDQLSLSSREACHMLDSFCPWCGDFTFEDVTCVRCDGFADREPASNSLDDTAAA